MSQKFREATVFACDFVEEFYDRNGKFRVVEMSFAEALALATGHVTLVPPDIDESVPKAQKILDGKSYSVTDQIAREIAFLSKTDAEFFDLCIQICAVNFANGASLPPVLNKFAATVLFGVHSRPSPRNRPRKRDWVEKFLLISTVRVLVSEFKLNAVRNDVSEQTSASDALSEALTVCGRPTSYSEINNLMVHKNFQRIREEIELFSKLAHVLAP